MLSGARQRGFNLTEAMITLAVLALLIGAAVPSMSDWLRGARVRGLAESTLDGLQKARMEAMRRNQVVTFWMVSTPAGGVPDETCTLANTFGAWVISLDDPAGRCDAAPSPTVTPRVVEKHGPGRTDVVVNGARNDGSAATSVSFNGFGQTTRAAVDLQRIDFSHSDSSVRRLRIEISGGGNIRMCDLEVAPPDLRACTPSTP